jgi:hypothetical protein
MMTFTHVHSKDRDMLAHNTSVVANVLSEPFVDPDTAANYLQITRRHLLEMVRKGLIPGHALDLRSQKTEKIGAQAY